MNCLITTDGPPPPPVFDAWDRGPTCPTCQRGTLEPEEAPREFEDAWYCGDCGLYRVPAPGSDLERQMQDTLDEHERTIPEMQADWYRERFGQITGEVR